MEDKILYNSYTTHCFSDYGIEIPLLNERISETVNHFKIKHQNFCKISKENSFGSFANYFLAL